MNPALGRRERGELALMAVGLASWATLLVVIPTGVALVVIRLAGRSTCPDRRGRTR
jgi:hypothetical protein